MDSKNKKSREIESEKRKMTFFFLIFSPCHNSIENYCCITSESKRVREREKERMRERELCNLSHLSFWSVQKIKIRKNERQIERDHNTEKGNSVLKSIYCFCKLSKWAFVVTLTKNCWINILSPCERSE